MVTIAKDTAKHMSPIAFGIFIRITTMSSVFSIGKPEARLILLKNKNLPPLQWELVSPKFITEVTTSPGSHYYNF